MDTYESDAGFVRPPRSAGPPKGPLLDGLGIRVAERGEGRSRLEYVVSPQHLRTFGLLHGGIVATLLDTAMGIAAYTHAPENRDVVTVQLNVNFIRPGWEGETLITVGEVRHSGRRTAVARGEVRTDQGGLVASGTATFLFVPMSDPAHRDPAGGLAETSGAS